ncbi:MAG: trigger factor [Bacteroidales bacterium]|jgi:trigger factor
MNINKENIDDLNAVLSVSLGKEDYEQRVQNVLEDYRKKARMDGFRPGKVPFGLIKKMYRKPVLVDEVNKLVSESISKYLVEQKLNILGEPLPHTGEMKSIDWDNDTEFEFKFDLGMAPEFELNISSKDKIPLYTIKVDNKLIDKYIESYSQRFGELESTEKMTDKAMVKAEIRELTPEGTPAEEGIHVDETTFSVELIKDDRIKKNVLAAKKGDVLILDLKKAYPNDTELAGMLKTDKSKVAGLSPDFEVTIKDISVFRHAEVNQALFDNVYGKGTITTEKEFREKIAEEAKKGLANDSEYRFGIDAKEALLRKFKSNLPNDFLKRWLLMINEGKFDKEQIEKEYDHFEEDLKWQLIKDKIVRDNNIEVTEEDLKQAAKGVARMQFAQYGMANVPDEHLEEFSKRMLSSQEDRNKLRTRVVEDKVINFVRTTVKVDNKEISSEKFNKLFEK